MGEHKLTEWEAGNDLAACCDYLGEKEEEAFRAGFAEHAKVLRECRVKIAKFFNVRHRNSHVFALGPTRVRTDAAPARKEGE